MFRKLQARCAQKPLVDLHVIVRVFFPNFRQHFNYPTTFSEGYQVLTAVVMKCSVYWDIMHSPLKVNQRFGGTCCLQFQSPRIIRQSLFCLPLAFTLVSCSAYSSTMKIEATCFSETSVDFQWTTRHYIPVNRTVQLVVKVSHIEF
jgi:hypothetical protein